MRNRLVELRYSQALLNRAASKDTLEALLKDLEVFLDVLEKHPDILKFFSARKITNEEKSEVLKKSLGHKVSQDLLLCVAFLLEKKRFGSFATIVREYHRKVMLALGLVEVRLITPFAIEPAIKDAIIQKMEASFQKKVRLVEEINEKMIGGGILLIGNQMIDFSVKGKLARLKDDLLAINI